MSHIPIAFIELFSLPDAISQGCKNGCHITCSQFIHSLEMRNTRKKLSEVIELFSIGLSEVIDTFIL